MADDKTGTFPGLEGSGGGEERQDSMCGYCNCNHYGKFIEVGGRTSPVPPPGCAILDIFSHFLLPPELSFVTLIYYIMYCRRCNFSMNPPVSLLVGL